MKNKKKIYFWRTVHGIAMIYLLFCIYILVDSKINNYSGPIFYLAVVSLVVEFILIMLNNWECPLNPIHDRLGDEKRLFGLFIPEKLRPYGLPVLIFIGFCALAFWFFG
jgi:hypothetical protein